MENYKDYSEKKSDGRVEIVSAGGGYAIAKKKWNPETGEQDSPEIVSVDIQELQDRKTHLQNEIAEIDVVLADIQKITQVK